MTFEKIKFEDDEHVITTVHRHWLTLFTKLFSIGVFALAPLLVWILILVFESSYQSITTIHFSEFSNYFVFIYSMWLLYVWMGTAFTLMNYYLDTWTVTNRRIIVIDQHGFFRRHIGSFRLEKLQDLNVEINGIIATLFDYGTIEAETASEGLGEFKAHFLPHPRELKSLIISATDSLSSAKTL